MRQHIASAFDRDLEGIQAQIMKMGGLVEASIREYLEEASYRKAMAQYLSILGSQTTIEGVELPIADGPLVQ